MHSTYYCQAASAPCGSCLFTCHASKYSWLAGRMSLDTLVSLVARLVDKSRTSVPVAAWGATNHRLCSPRAARHTAAVHSHMDCGWPKYRSKVWLFHSKTF